jgi:pilus assembly protein CpaC
MSKWTPKGRVSLTFLRVVSAFCVPIIASCLTSGVCWAQNTSRVKIETASPQKLSLTVGKSVIIGSPDPVKRISLAAPEVADSMVLSPRQIYIIAKVPGVTNLTLWGADDHVSTIIDLEISPDISRLKEDLHRIFPEEKSLRVTGAHDNVTLSGTISSTSNLSQVLALAEPYFPGKVVNLLEVSGVHQVMIEVRVAEMSRSLLRRLGFNFAYLSSSGKNFGLTLLNKLSSFPAQGFPGNPIGVSDKINALFQFMSNDTTWTVFVDALKEEGLLKVLAEPTLITLSGKSANFLAGGEFPVPVPQAAGVSTTITVEYKPFGVGLNFTPVVLSNKKINMTVAPEVSELDFSNAITISGFVVPAVTTRRVSTVIELADGQSFAIAGLLKDEVREIVSKFPVLGDIPVLGALFRSSSFQKNETELIVIVTPHLVKPLDMEKQTLPTDRFIEPDEFEFYLLGKLEGRDKKPESGLRMEGEFGHIIPK